MSYFSDKEYKKKSVDDLWFERLYYNRWFSEMDGPILDIGCATGNFIAVKPDIIEGIDIDADSVKITAKRGLKAKKLDIEKESESLTSDKYQGVYAKHVIEHLENPLHFLKETHRILKKGGLVVISTPHCPYILRQGFYDDYTHKRPFTKRSLEMIAYDAGFRNIKVYEDFRCFPGLGLVMRLTHLSPKVVRFAQSIFGVRGLSLILEATKK